MPKRFLLWRGKKKDYFNPNALFFLLPWSNGHRSTTDYVNSRFKNVLLRNQNSKILLSNSALSVFSLVPSHSSRNSTLVLSKFNKVCIFMSMSSLLLNLDHVALPPKGYQIPCCATYNDRLRGLHYSVCKYQFLVILQTGYSISHITKIFSVR